MVSSTKDDEDLHVGEATALKVADKFHRLFVLHNALCAWRMYMEHARARRLQRRQEQALQLRQEQEEGRKVQVADRFHKLYRLHRSLHHWAVYTRSRRMARLAGLEHASRQQAIERFKRRTVQQVQGSQPVEQSERSSSGSHTCLDNAQHLHTEQPAASSKGCKYSPVQRLASTEHMTGTGALHATVIDGSRRPSSKTAEPSSLGHRDAACSPEASVPTNKDSATEMVELLVALMEAINTREPPFQDAQPSLSGGSGYSPSVIPSQHTDDMHPFHAEDHNASLHDCCDRLDLPCTSSSWTERPAASTQDHSSWMKDSHSDSLYREAGGVVEGASSASGHASLRSHEEAVLPSPISGNAQESQPTVDQQLTQVLEMLHLTKQLPSIASYLNPGSSGLATTGLRQDSRGQELPSTGAQPPYASTKGRDLEPIISSTFLSGSANSQEPELALSSHPSPSRNGYHSDWVDLQQAREPVSLGALVNSESVARLRSNAQVASSRSADGAKESPVQASPADRTLETAARNPVELGKQVLLNGHELSRARKSSLFPLRPTFSADGGPPTRQSADARQFSSSTDGSRQLADPNGRSSPTLTKTGSGNGCEVPVFLTQHSDSPLKGPALVSPSSPPLWEEGLLSPTIDRRVRAQKLAPLLTDQGPLVLVASSVESLNSETCNLPSNVEDEGLQAASTSSFNTPQGAKEGSITDERGSHAAAHNGRPDPLYLNGSVANLPGVHTKTRYGAKKLSALRDHKRSAASDYTSEGNLEPGHTCVTVSAATRLSSGTLGVHNSLGKGASGESLAQAESSLKSAESASHRLYDKGRPATAERLEQLQAKLLQNSQHTIQKTRAITPDAQQRGVPGPRAGKVSSAGAVKQVFGRRVSSEVLPKVSTSSRPGTAQGRSSYASSASGRSTISASVSARERGRNGGRAAIVDTVALELEAQQTVLAQLNYARHLVTNYGLRPWRQLLDQATQDWVLAALHHTHRAARQALQAWRSVWWRRAWTRVCRDAEAFGKIRRNHQVSLLRSHLRALSCLTHAITMGRAATLAAVLSKWKGVWEAGRRAWQSARDMAKSRQLLRSFHAWHEAVEQQARAHMYDELQLGHRAERHAARTCLLKVIRSWAEATQEALQVRQLEQQRQATMSKIRGWLDEMEQSPEVGTTWGSQGGVCEGGDSWAGPTQAEAPEVEFLERRGALARTHQMEVPKVGAPERPSAWDRDHMGVWKHEEGWDCALLDADESILDDGLKEPWGGKLETIDFLGEGNGVSSRADVPFRVKGTGLECRYQSNIQHKGTEGCSFPKTLKTGRQGLGLGLVSHEADMKLPSFVAGFLSSSDDTSLEPDSSPRVKPTSEACRITSIADGFADDSVMIRDANPQSLFSNKKGRRYIINKIASELTWD